jgi:hypothetical protein
MRAQQVKLSSNDDLLGIQEAQLEPGNLSAISSGLDKLARGFQALEDGTKSSDSSLSLIKPEGLNVTESTALPSKTVMIKGAGRRRRSASTGGADLDETGTGTGAKAAVKVSSVFTGPFSKGFVFSLQLMYLLAHQIRNQSTPIKRYSMAVDKENSKITSALLHNTIQPAMSKTDLQ